MTTRTQRPLHCREDRESTCASRSREHAARSSAAIRLEAFVTRTGVESWMHDAEIDAWYAQYATEWNRTHRQALLHQIQHKLYEEVRFIPI